MPPADSVQCLSPTRPIPRVGLLTSSGFMATSAPLAILSGMYLFATLHPDDQSAGGVVLKAGAAAALPSAVVGVLFSRTAGRRLHQLSKASGQQAKPSPEVAREMAALRMRIAVSARVAAGLLGVTVLAMATYRYAAAVL